jgi:hypothetical protein
MVPGMRLRRYAGLLLADDLVFLAETIEKLRKMLSIATEWADRHEMTFGIKKCGVMAIHTTDGVADTKHPDTVALERENLSIQGALLPVVQVYKYLGVLFASDLDLARVSSARKASAQGALFSLKALLRDKEIALPIKSLLLKQCVMSVANYGGELVGMNRKLSTDVQAVIRQGARWCFGARKAVGVTSGTVLLMELGMVSTFAERCGQAARLARKFPLTKTVIKSLLADPFDPIPAGIPRVRAWMQNTRAWTKKLDPKGTLWRANSTDPAKYGRVIKKLAFKLELAEMTDEAASRYSKSTNAYVAAGLTKTNRYIAKSAQFPDVVKGVNTLAAMRTGTLLTGERAASMSLIDSRYEDECPCCSEHVPETTEHILMVCKRWSPQREALEKALSHAGCSVAALSYKKKARLLLGGQWDGKGSRRMRNFFVQGAHPKPRQGMDPWFVVVARFLQSIYKERQGLLWATKDKEQQSQEDDSDE